MIWNPLIRDSEDTENFENTMILQRLSLSIAVCCKEAVPTSADSAHCLPTIDNDMMIPIIMIPMIMMMMIMIPMMRT